MATVPDAAADSNFREQGKHWQESVFTGRGRNLFRGQDGPKKHYWPPPSESPPLKHTSSNRSEAY
eukprot:3055426-Rhodomonas_salina.1